MSAIPCADTGVGGWRAALNAKALANAADVLRSGFRAGVNGKWVRELEERFAAYVGAGYAVAMCNGTATLHAGLVALTEQREVAVTPLTMSATTAAVVAAGKTPVYRDVDPHTWLMLHTGDGTTALAVSLYGLSVDQSSFFDDMDDAAQRLGPQGDQISITSYSFQASKHLTCGEGGMLVTNHAGYADVARSFASLGYDLSAGQARIDHRAIKSPDTVRHVRFGINYRMSDLQAAVLLAYLEHADTILAERRACAAMYRQAHEGCDWLTPQAVPEGATHAYWCYPLLLPDRGSWPILADTVERHGGERPYGAWRLAYHEPAYAHLAPPPGTCPVAESIQPRLMQFQTNDVPSAERNAVALHAAIREVGG